MAYNWPGVYVEEVPSGARPIQSVGTSTAAFLGKAPNLGARVDEAVAINNWTQFLKIYGTDDSTSTDLARAVFGFFNNGGGRCYVVNIGDRNTLSGGGRNRTGVALLEEKEDVSIVAAPGFCDIRAYDALISHCVNMRDRIAILDPPADVEDIDQLKSVAQDTGNSEPEAGGEEESSDAPKRKRRSKSTGGVKPPASDRAAFYYPWIRAKDPIQVGAPIVNTAPSGHIAGIYARTDSKFGVHKAPANEMINGALGLTYQLTKYEQGDLNDLGVNCIRFFPEAGIKVWGARTLSDDQQWRYINVRRLFFMIMKSIERGTSPYVFESNEERTWKAITRDVTAFLTLLWRDGALKGATPEQAFYVKCDAETNPTEVIDAGRLVTEIGIAPVKPAEFIIFRIGQWAGGTEVETEGEGEGEASE